MTHNNRRRFVVKNAPLNSWHRGRGAARFDLWSVLKFLVLIVTMLAILACFIRGPLLAHGQQQQQQQANSNNSRPLPGVNGRPPLPDWRWHYVEELKRGFELRNKDSTIDTRLANVLQVANNAQGLDVDLLSFEPGLSSHELERMEKLVAGPRVDHDRCARELGSMFEQMNELARIVRIKRNSSDERLELELEARIWQKSAHDTRHESDSESASPKPDGSSESWPPGELDQRELGEHHIRLARVLDSMGRYDAGLLTGRSFLEGSYEQCISTHLLLDEARGTSDQQEPAAEGDDGPRQSKQITPMRYCVAKLDMSKHMSPELAMSVPSATGRARQHIKPYIKVALCLPTSCHTASYRKFPKRFEAILRKRFELPSGTFVDTNPRLESVFCLVDSDSEAARMPLSAYAFGSLAAVWLALIVYSTCVQHCKRSESLPQADGSHSGPTKSDSEQQQKPINSSLWHVFDLYESWRDFVGHSNLSADQLAKQQAARDDTGVDINVLNPIKILGCTTVVMGHSVVTTSTASMSALQALSTLGDSSLSMLLASLTVLVDSFYVMSGLLSTYIALDRFTRRRPLTGPTNNGTSNNNKQLGWLATWKRGLTQCSQLIVMRHLRIVPLLFLVFWFKKSVFPRLGHGPHWDHGINSASFEGACQLESWWSPLTFGAARLPMARQCLSHTWSLSGDLFFSFVMAPIIVLMIDVPQLAVTSAFLIMAASLAMVRQATDSLQVEQVESMREARLYGVTEMFREHSHIYTAPYYRMFSPLIGCLAGYLLHIYRRRQRQLAELKRNKLATAQQLGAITWPLWIRAASWLSMVFLIVYLTLGPAMPYLRETLFKTHPLHHHAMRMSFHALRFAWAASNAFLFLRMTTDWRRSWIMQLSAAQVWQILVKLNFGILLVHMNFIVYDFYMRPINFFWIPNISMNTFSYVYFNSSLLALTLYLLIESPLSRLIKMALG